ncbi:holo-(acyl-carrier protein) synthase, putative [Plasmodium knowlesi strain H]|uniref:Holo-(Acyl-carrier protein) synthase, putative n=3 Tax=Plasmodium knowlesi TaxID=5850 RepID=A0A5K1UGC7_PLAKH|nr:holo-[acyl-carrier-protein] synthase, putative [Plasmodium knowlesi strain H]OTN67964.1 putative Holo-(Acyl-carrier protein) synthase [Plasmodium knowlesi]CAA9987016.1 holo-[acyl-carrier-protein] synthase, putative [Plasmodium knowlesi strain H]SBO26682.1 holo-(acyl-carrier protein) synthase, putative [Plasmodium knowlesi strain H]SBO28221.1 holo-(acyl-carrier protein) synthase, putative [Plasmodium knowlesi strain H]VVS76490.1 holo-[acyl-carrier-protein] synthase, putative [Plasmodium know|eukprot:XP_002258261.1 holo-(acyl-carrier protein) synthase, putative [Plasmodium knowlesi strain H]
MPGSATHKIRSACTKVVKVLFLYWLVFVKKQKVPRMVHSLRITKKKSCIQMGRPPGGKNYISPYESRDSSSERKAPFNCLYRAYFKGTKQNPLGSLISVHPVKKLKLMQRKNSKSAARYFYIHNFQCPEKVLGKICPLGRESKWKSVRYMSRLTKVLMVGGNDEEMFNQINRNIMRGTLGEEDHMYNSLYGRSDTVWGENYEINSFLEIVNNQTEVPIDLANFEKEIRKLIRLMRFEDFQLNITFVSLNQMKELNKTHRRKNEPTDIISLLHYVDNGQGVSGNSELQGSDIPGGRCLRSGDIYLCPAYISRECVLARVNYERSLLNDQSSESGKVEKIGGVSTLDNREDEDRNWEQVRPRGVNKLFRTLFCVQERLALYVLHGLIHLTNKDHVNNADEYNAFMDIEEDMISKYLKFHHYTHTFYSHYVIGFGTDILNVNRIYKILQKKNGAFFLRKILSSLELRELAQGYLGEAVGCNQLGDNLNDQFGKSDDKANCGGVFLEQSERSLAQRLTTNCALKLAIHVSKKFASKEAIVKSMGRGLSSISKYGLSMNDIEVRNDKYGKPLVFLYDQARKIANEMGIVNIFLSLSDEKITCPNHNVKKDESAMCNFCTYLIHAQALSVGSNV